MLLWSGYIWSFILWRYRLELSAVVGSLVAVLSFGLLYWSAVTSGRAVVFRYTIWNDKHVFQ